MTEEFIVYNGEDIFNKRYGKLIVKKEVDNRCGHRRVECLCDCGKSSIVFLMNLTRDNTKSCGCGKGWSKHLHSKNGLSVEYSTWRNMKFNRSNIGIKICDRWNSEDGFIRFLHDMGNKPTPFHRFSRINITKGFTLENCFWKAGKNKEKQC